MVQRFKQVTGAPKARGIRPVFAFYRRFPLEDDVPHPTYGVSQPELPTAPVDHGVVIGVTPDQHHVKLHAAAHGPLGGDPIIDPITVIVSSGTSFPSSPTAGEIFLRTDEGKIYIRIGAAWYQIAVLDASDNLKIGGRYLKE